MSEITIERAQPETAEELSRLSMIAKAHWGYPEEWLKAWQDELTLTPQFIAGNEVYVARVDGQIAGFIAVDSTEGQKKAELAHEWVLPEFMGLGVGKKLFEQAAEVARGHGARELIIESDPHAAGFYEKMGARPSGSVAAPVAEARDRELPRYRLTL